MSRGQMHPLEAAFHKHQMEEALKNRDKALEAAKSAKPIPGIEFALEKLHKTGEAEVEVNGEKVKIYYAVDKSPLRKDFP